MSGTGQNQGRKAGRPVGSVLTPKKLLEVEMRETAKLNKEVRALLFEQVSAIRKELSESANLDKRLLVMDTLTAVVEKQAKGLDSVAKHLMTQEKDTGGGDGSEASEAEVLSSILGRKGQ